ncbi:nitrile hydratase subunit beta [Acuticoccus mangrovi]|uniref:Nitrile hydratase subunit beta n=1 Tax=Acuticoccus mangrovi TaxID=2796142 RepID=A0A934MG00_9HYPH|nr:nitrile hydratase subunit beta [Acuticoccus mangrovi]MBJ3776023.1 nitrile hydratase subunit beta [Acuticoccus mangrovi]
MNGPADIGGAHGFGPVTPERDEPIFHAEWERRAFALTLAMGATGLWTIDRSRAVRESLPRPLYYTSTYYEIWLTALERLVADAGVAEGEAVPRQVLTADTVRPAMARGGPVDRPGPAPAFAAGDRVRVKPMRPASHTRAPQYVRGREGTVVRVHGVHVFPDTNAAGAGEAPAPLYNVAFAAETLWGPDTTAADVHVDLFEPYLEPA